MSDDLVNIEIDGRPMQARKGAMIIEVSDSAGIGVPRFCYHRKLAVAANCRMCLVEVEKAPKPLPACATPVTEGMKVHTRSALARRAQKSVMEFLLINHPLDCPICDQGGECELQDLAMGYGRDVSRFQERKRVVKDKNIGPLIATEMTRCIHCTRCVRFGDEIAGVSELGLTGRGERVEIGTFVERAVTSELSGNVIDLCPVGALTSKPFRYRARAWELQERPGIAPHDCLHSNIAVHIRRGEPMRVVPGENEAINEVWLSDRDRFSYEGLKSEDRLLAPMLRDGDEWREVDWETALAATAETLRSVAAGELGALISPQCSVEEAFLAQKILRGLGSSNIDSRLRQADFSDQAMLATAPSLGQSVVDLENSDCVLLVGAYPRKEQPLINHRIRKAVRKGARVMLLNPVDWDFNYDIAEKLVVSPRDMLAALAGVVRAAGVADAPLAKVKPDAVGSRIAEALAGAAHATIILGGSIESHPDGSALRALARRLSDATGARLGMLPSGGNAVGTALAGALPHRACGGEAITKAGLDARAMLQGAVKGMLLVGVEPDFDCFDAADCVEALAGMSGVVALTAYRSPSLERCANVMLPMAPFVETDASYVNIEGRWQTASAAAPPRGESRPAWRVLRVLGNVLDLDGFEYMSAAEVAAEVQAGGAAETAPAGPTLPKSLNSGVDGDSLCRVGDVAIYGVDAVVRRAPALQATADATWPPLTIASATAERLGLEPGDRVRVRQGARSVEAEITVDPRLPADCLRVQSGTALAARLGPAFGAITVEKA